MTTPTPEGCEYDGIARRGHGQRWTYPIGWHTYLQPTRTTIERRMRAARGLPIKTEE